jgi:hypothetical protein
VGAKVAVWCGNNHFDRSLTVVSNDARVRTAAARRGCPYLKCGEYVDALMSPPRAAAPQTHPEKDERATPEEMAAWRTTFGE